LGEQPAELFTIDEFRLGIEKLRAKKASRPSRVVAEMPKSSDESGILELLNICNPVVKVCIMPFEKSWMVNVYKGKGGAFECSSYRVIKLLEQPMKVLERVVERRL